MDIESMRLESYRSFKVADRGPAAAAQHCRARAWMPAVVTNPKSTSGAS